MKHYILSALLVLCSGHGYASYFLSLFKEEKSSKPVKSTKCDFGMRELDDFVTIETSSFPPRSAKKLVLFDTAIPKNPRDAIASIPLDTAIVLEHSSNKYFCYPAMDFRMWVLQNGHEEYFKELLKRYTESPEYFDFFLNGKGNGDNPLLHLVHVGHAKNTQRFVDALLAGSVKKESIQEFLLTPSTLNARETASLSQLISPEYLVNEGDNGLLLKEVLRVLDNYMLYDAKYLGISDHGSELLLQPFDRTAYYFGNMAEQNPYYFLKFLYAFDDEGETLLQKLIACATIASQKDCPDASHTALVLCDLVSQLLYGKRVYDLVHTALEQHQYVCAPLVDYFISSVVPYALHAGWTARFIAACKDATDLSLLPHAALLAVVVHEVEQASEQPCTLLEPYRDTLKSLKELKFHKSILYSRVWRIVLNKLLAHAAV